MSIETLNDKKAASITQANMGDVVTQGLARALEARKMAELSATELNDVSGGASLILYPYPLPFPFPLPFPWGIILNPIATDPIAVKPALA